MSKKLSLPEALIEARFGSTGEFADEMRDLLILGQDDSSAVYTLIHLFFTEAEFPEAFRSEAIDALMTLPEDGADADVEIGEDESEVVISNAEALIALDGTRQLEAKLAEPGLSKALKKYLDRVMAQVIQESE